MPGPAAAAVDRVLVVMPTYNEIENIDAIVPAVLGIAPELDLLIVDDSSPDGTGRRADELRAAEQRLHVLHRPGKAGLGPAYVAGLLWALNRGYGRAVQMDADFSHRPQDLPELLAASAAADVVVGSRNIPGGSVANWSLPRQLLSRFGSWYVRALLHIQVHDCTSGFRVLSRRALAAVDYPAINSNGYAFQIELLYAWQAAGMRLVEAPIVFPDRVRGSSKMSLAIAAEAALVVLRFKLGLSRPAVASSKESQSGAG